MKKAPRKKKLLLKIIAWAAAGFIGVIAVVIISLLLIIDEKYEEWATAAAGSATGRELIIDDGFNVHLGRKVGISAKGIRFANAEWGTRADMITADRLDIRVDLLPLIKGVLDYTIEIDGADILLEKNEDGKSNWMFGGSGLPAGKESSLEKEDTPGPFILPVRLYSRNIEIRKVAIAYVDKSGGGKEVQTDVETMSVKVEGGEMQLSLKAVYGGAPIEVQGSLGRIDDWHSNRATPISLKGLLNGAALGVNGSVGPLLPQPSAELVVSLKAETVSAFSPFVGLELPDLGLLQLDAQLKYSAQTLALEVSNATLKSEGMEASVTARVEDLMTFSGFKGTIDAELGSLSNLSQITKSELPKTGPWNLNARAAMEDGLGGSTTLSADIDGEGIKAVVEATLADIKFPGIFTATFSLDTASLSRLGNLLNIELTDAGPLKVTGSGSAKPGEYRLGEVLVLLDKAEMRGDLAYTAPAEGDSGRPKLSGQIKIKDLDITPLFASGGEDHESATGQQQVQKEASEVAVKSEQPVARKLFSSEPFSAGVLQDYDIDFKLDAANFTLGRGFSVDGSTALILDQGLLKLGPLNFSGTTGGGGEGMIMFDASKPDVKLDVVMDFKRIVPPQYGGTMDLDIDLDGSGKSLAALMGSLNGHFIVVLEDAELKKSAITKFGTGLLNQINPLDSDTTILECAIARFDAIDGIADFTKKIAAQTTEVTWVGSGEINLKTEEVDFGIHPVPRKKLSSLTSVGLAELIHIGGTLAEPKIGVDAKDVAKKSFRYSAYIATGGLSFLAEKMFDNQQANRDQCKRILTEMGKN